MIRALLQNDLKLVFRDRMLFLLFGMMLLAAVGLRFGLPALDQSLASAGVLPSATNPLRLRDFYPLIVSFLVAWQGAQAPGVVMAFLLIDEREDRTLVALRVTPLLMRHYALYRVTLPFVSAVFFALLLGLIAGQVLPRALPPAAFLTVSLSSAFAAPVLMLLLAAVSADKVQGLAFTKFVGLASLLVFVGWFSSEPLQWALGVIFPPLLSCRALWLAMEGHPGWWHSALAAAGIQLCWLWLLLRRFERSL